MTAMLRRTHRSLGRELERLAELCQLPIGSGPLDGDWTHAADLAGSRFDLAETYFIHAQTTYPGLDRRGQAAFFVGGVSYGLITALALLDLSGHGFAGINAQHYGLVFRDGELRHRLDLGGRAPTVELSGALAVAETAERILAPLVETLFVQTRLARAAQWRLIADSFAGAFLTTGRALNRENHACADASIALGNPHLRMSNPQTGYLKVKPAGSHDALESAATTFLSRGGCCRNYTSGADYCASCVLRSQQDQRSLLANWLAENA